MRESLRDVYNAVMSLERMHKVHRSYEDFEGTVLWLIDSIEKDTDTPEVWRQTQGIIVHKEPDGTYHVRPALYAEIAPDEHSQ